MQGKAGDEYRACVIADRKAVRDHVRKYFQEHGANTKVIEANEKDAHSGVGIRFSTMHRAKGLEFDQVVVLAREADLEGEDADQYRKLVYVALTRAKRDASLLLY